MVLKLIFGVLWASSLSAAQTAPVAPNPVGKIELVELVATGSTSQRIAGFIQQRGIDFAPDDSFLKSLELERADASVVAALKSASVVNRNAPLGDAEAQARELEVLHYLHLAAIANRNNFHPQAAEPELRAAVAADPRSPYAHLALGKLLVRLGQWDAAAAEFRNALELEPDLSDGHLELGRALAWDRSLGSEATILELKKAAELAPYDPTAQYAYESALLGTGKGKEDAEKRAELIKKFGSAAAVPRIRMGGQVAHAKLVSHPPPRYPEGAKATGTQGTVKLEILIGADGSVKDWLVISGEPTLVDAAVDAVAKWQYQPTLLNKQPVEVVTEVDINFSLRPR